MNDLNGTSKRAALPAHQGTDKWFAMGDALAEQPAPSTTDTRELATIGAQRARRAERIGIAAGVLTLVVLAFVALFGHRRSAASVPTTAAVAIPPAAPLPVAAAAIPAPAPAPPVAATRAPSPVSGPPVAAPAPKAAVTERAAAGSPARSKHKQTAHKTSAPRRR